MIARSVLFTLAATAAFTVSASAQTMQPAPGTSQPTQVQPQTPPNAGAAEAKPQTVTAPGGATTLPANGSQASPTQYGPDPASGNGFTATNPLGPQQDLGKRINRTVHYVVGDYIAPPLVYNELGGPAKGENYRSYDGRAIFEVPLGQYDVYVGGEARKYVYPTRSGLTYTLGGAFYLPSFDATEYDEDVRAGIKVAGPRLYGAVSYLRRGGDIAPQQHGLGYGVEKLADVDQNFSLHGSVFFYPNVGGNYTFGAGLGDRDLSYRVVRYLIGASIVPNHSPVFLDAGYLGDRSNIRSDAPIGFNHQGPYVGLGIHF